MAELMQCSIGLYLQTEVDCHKTTYTQNYAVKKDLKIVERLQPASLDLIKRRVGLDYNLQSTDTLCLHHEKCLLDKYSHLQTACCDPYERHKSSVRKHLRVVDVTMSDNFSVIGLNVKPGFKLCWNSFMSISSPTDNNNDDVPDDDDDTDPDFVLPAHQLQTTVSEGFAMVGCSPLKLSKYPKHQRSSYIVRKVQNLEAAFVSTVCRETRQNFYMLQSNMISSIVRMPL